MTLNYNNNFFIQFKCTFSKKVYGRTFPLFNSVTAGNGARVELGMTCNTISIAKHQGW